MFLKKRNETPQPDRAGNPSGCGVFLCFFLHKIAIEQKADPQSGGVLDAKKEKAEKIKELKKDERKLLYLRYFADKTQTEIGEELGISQVQVSRMEKKILKTMREHAKE